MSYSQKSQSRRSKKVTKNSSPEDQAELKKQYDIIRKDLLKLRQDLQKSLEVAKEMIDKKGFINQLLKSR